MRNDDVHVTLYGGPFHGRVEHIPETSYRRRNAIRVSLSSHQEVAYYPRLYTLPGGRRVWRWVWCDADGLVDTLDPTENDRVQAMGLMNEQGVDEGGGSSVF